MTQTLSADDIAQLFTRDGHYLRARWGRPVAPVIFGLDDDSLAIFRNALTAVLQDIRHQMVETDPEMGANMMTFFLRDWAELEGIPDLEHLTGQTDLLARLTAQGADQYRLFRFDPDGGIRASICFVNMGGGLADAHPGQLAETLAVRALLTFAGDVAVSPRIAALLRAAYDPVLPVAADDPSDALRLFARMGARNA
ncbi:hypothetical protein [Paracoccus sulfuroxidans]|uniref:Uncharacterized protein n=1 Tax=Paracoccus sulfuroxidans TaxID=384678 RepID=A0A562NQS4_9RHOB|nr:hypothetical protein [Paracoccus sulfuroxidans]TWI34420.1 hypothetical protein IQ24_01938 [Paracoccus sulfuroxidans]